MKVISSQNNLQNNFLADKNKKQKQSKQNFGNGAGVVGALGKGLQVLDANPMAAVTFLDVSTAIGPNTVIDAKERNPVQAFETFRRESSGLLINCLLPGVAALGVGRAIMSKAIGSKFKGIKAQHVWAGKDTITESNHEWKSLKAKPDNKEAQIHEFVEKSFKKVVPNEGSELGRNPHNLQEQKKLKEVSEKFSKAIIDAKEGDTKIDSKLMKETYKELAQIYGDTKSVKVQGGAKKYSTSLKNHIRDTYAMSKAYSHKSVNSGNIDLLSSKLKKMIGKKSAVTMAGVGVLALAMQKINRKITEKTSGKKGYQGYSDNSVQVKQTAADKRKLWGAKGLAAGWMGALTVGAMGKVTRGTFNFTAPTTTINQARSFALLTNVGRIGAAEEKNELKDTVLRDSMIFLNLYVLGDYVQKGVVTGVQNFYKKNKGIDLNLLNEDRAAEKKMSPAKKAINWVRNKSVKSFEEIEGTAKSSKAKTSLRKNIVTLANISGIAYSLVALGIAMPVMIARMTQKNRKKQLEQLKLQQGRSHDSNVSMAGGFSSNKTKELFKAFKN